MLTYLSVGVKENENIISIEHSQLFGSLEHSDGGSESHKLTNINIKLCKLIIYTCAIKRVR
jgi:hypothetical protein